jgi:hypothetical protein
MFVLTLTRPGDSGKTRIRSRSGLLRAPEPPGPSPTGQGPSLRPNEGISRPSFGRGRPRATPSRACCLSEDNQRLSTQEGLHLRDLAPCTAFWRLSLAKVGAMEGPSGKSRLPKKSIGPRRRIYPVTTPQDRTLRQRIKRWHLPQRPRNHLLR